MDKLQCRSLPAAGECLQKYSRILFVPNLATGSTTELLPFFTTGTSDFTVPVTSNTYLNATKPPTEYVPLTHPKGKEAGT
jgi:hypothetical protein